MDQKTSRKRAAKICGALFFLFLIGVAATENWWPGIMLMVGLPLALRQYLMGRAYDMAISLLVFVGTYVSIEYEIAWQVFLPILFTLGAIYVLFKEMIEPETEAEKEEDQNHELEEK